MTIHNACVSMVTCIQWAQKMGNMSQKYCTLIWMKYLDSIGLKGGHLDFIQVMIILNWQIKRYQRKTSNVKNVKYNCGLIWQKNIEKNEPFSSVMEKNCNEPGDFKFGVFKDFLRKVTN